MRRAPILLTLILSFGCTSKLVVRQVTGPGSIGEADEGVYYALPKTVMTVDVPVVRKRTILGEFSHLVPVFFPFDEPPLAEVSYSLGEPSLGTFGVPDAKHVYLAVIKGGRFEDKKLALNFGEDGTVEKVDAESNNRTLEFVGQVVKSAAALGGKFLLGGTAAAAPPPPPPPPPKPGAAAPPPPPPSACADVETRLGGPGNAFARAVRRQCEDLKPPSLQVSMRDYVANGTEPDQPGARARTFIRAYEAARRLVELRDRRDKILDPSTLAAASGDPLASVLEAIDAEIDGIVARFFGTEEEKPYWRASYQLTADDSSSGSAATQTVALFRYSPSDGICPAPPPASTIGVTVQEMLAPPGRGTTCSNETTIEVDISRPPSQFPDTVIGAGPHANGERGLFYRIPGKAHVSLYIKRTTETGTVRSGKLQYSPSLAQFGVIVSLPATTGGRRTQYVADFYSATGAMKSFSLESEAQLDKAIAADIGDAGSTLLDARAARLEAERKRQEARDEAADELTQLKRQADTLETQVRIKAAQGKLASPSTSPQ